MSVLVTTGSSIKSLIITRSLGKKGVEVIVGDKKNNSIAALSKYAKGKIKYTSPLVDEKQFIIDLKTYLKKNKSEVLFPTHSEDTYIIAKYKHELEPYVKIPLHDYDSITMANDKAYVMNLAKKLSIRIPKTIIVDDLTKLRDISKSISYPAVIKLKSRSSSTGLSYAYSADELIRQYNECINAFHLSINEYPIIQEYIDGDGYGVSLLFNHGELRAKFTHKRLREYPPSGGPSTFRISVIHPEMEKIAIKLMKYLKWHGVVMVEFKLDRKTKEPVLLEINPRFWGSLNQAICAGVDFPYLLYQMAIDGDVEPVLDYTLGVKTRVAFIDYITIIKSLKKSYSRIELLKSFFQFYPDDIISMYDPVPAFSFVFSHIGKREE